MIKLFSFIISHMPHHGVIMTGGPGIGTLPRSEVLRAPSLGTRTLGPVGLWKVPLWGRWQLMDAFRAPPLIAAATAAATILVQTTGTPLLWPGTFSGKPGYHNLPTSDVTWPMSLGAGSMKNPVRVTSPSMTRPVLGLQLFKLHVMHHYLLFVHGCELCHHLIQQLGWLYELWIWHASWVTAPLW